MGDPVFIVLKWKDIYGWFLYHLKRKSIRYLYNEKKNVIRNTMVYDSDM